MATTLDLGTDRSGTPRGIGWHHATYPTKGHHVTTAQIPDAAHRWRCGGCGNLTRFDVTRTRRTTEYWHFELSGDFAVDETEVKGEAIESVTCRWCGRSDAIELIDRNDATPAEDPAAG